MTRFCFNQTEQKTVIITMRFFQFFIALALIFFLFPGIYSSPKNNTLIYLSPVDVTTLDPGLVTDRYSSQIIANIFEGLTKYKKDSLEVEPLLAESWESFNGGKRWVFKLRRGVTFHDGEPLTSLAVVNSFSDRLRNKRKYNEWNSFYTYLEKVTAFDSHTVQFLLKEPYAPFLYQLASPKSSIIATRSFRRGKYNVIGTGPFKFGEIKVGRFVRIIRNETYWSRKALLAAVVFKVVQDQKWRVLQVRNGAADVALLESRENLDEIQTVKNLDIKSGRSSAVHFLAFNLRRGPFRDRRMREAVARLIDKEVVVRNIFQGFAENATTPVPPNMFGHNPVIRDYPFSIEKARALKEEAGYGEDLEVTLYYSDTSRNLENIAGVIARSGKKIGLLIKKKPIPFSDLVQIGYDKHDMLMLGWVGDLPDADVYLYPNFTEDSGRLNRSGYIKPDVSGMIKKARMTSDRTERETLYRQAQVILNKDLPWIPLYHLNDLLLCNRNVRGLHLQPLSFLNFRDVHFEGQ